MIHFRYLDSHYDHLFLWEELSDEIDFSLASACAVQDPQALCEALRNGAQEGPLVWIIHVHERMPDGSYFRLQAEQVKQWQTPVEVYYVTGGEVERIRHEIAATPLPENIKVYPYSLSLNLQQWHRTQLEDWKARFTAFYARSQPQKV